MNFENKCRYSSMVMILTLLSACSNSGDDNSTGLGSEIGIVNGYHIVRAFYYDEFDNITQTRVYEVDYERQVMDVISTYQTPNSDQPPTEDRSIAFIDEFGRLERWSDDLGTTIYEFNAQGLLSRYVEDYQGNEESTFSYNSVGRLLNRTRIFKTDGIVTQTQNYTYEYDSRGFLLSGSIVSVIEPQSAEPYFYTTGYTETVTMNYTVDSQGRVTRRTRDITSDQPDYGPFTQTDLYEYDSNGNVISTTSMSDGAFWNRRVFEYEQSKQPVYNRFLRIFRYFP